MKYISRLTALLLALLTLASSAGALTLDGLTEDQLLALYQAESNEVETVTVTGVLGETSEFTSSDATGYAADGYALQWYQVDAAGERTALTGESTDALIVTYTLEEQRFVCEATMDGALTLSTPIYIVAAETENMDDYLNVLTDHFYTIYWAGDESLADYIAVAHELMNQTWNVPLAEGDNLADRVTDAWWAEREDSWFEPELLCACVVSGERENDFCILDPQADHAATCGWYTGSPLLHMEETTDESGNISYTLYVLVKGEQTVLAKSEMLDGKYHYFRDVREGELGLFVAWLYIDEEGTPWLMPLESEKEIPAN